MARMPFIITPVDDQEQIIFKANELFREIYEEYLSNGSLMPVGAIIAWATATPPAGYLECDGSTVSRTTYAKLFKVLSTTYGTGNGSTTFNLPDMRGRFIRGWDHEASNDPDAADRTDRGDGITGDKIGTKQAHDTDQHAHNINPFAEYGAVGARYISDGSGGNEAQKYADGTTSGVVTQNWPSTGGNETRPININMMYCIKY